MNFNVLFTTVSALKFVIDFPVNLNETQDYFYFEGYNNTAHLFRKNATLLLHLSQNNGEENALYNTTLHGKNFQFSWNGFKVNEEKMMLHSSKGLISELEFEHFSFLSAIVEPLDIECTFEPIYYDMEKVNYWYFLIMMFVVGIIFESKTHGINILKRFLKRYESEYTTIYEKCSPTRNINESTNV